MSNVAVAVLAGVVSGVGGTAVTGYLALRKMRSDLAADYARRMQPSSDS